ncbi:MAG: BON domain-containing protein [Betaproteobacteria bacterium]|nr:MAG: BON domain-containing protein [Betaproteobacteria bacterium]
MEPEMKIQHTSALLAALVATSLGLVACQQRSSDTATPRADSTAPRVAATTTPSTTTPSTTTSSMNTPSTTTSSMNTPSSTTPSDATTTNPVDKAVAATDDAAITAKVKTAILAEPGLKSLQINVDTKDGTVTLSGTVDNADLRERAKQLASSTSGVKGVVDQLTVKTS